VTCGDSKLSAKRMLLSNTAGANLVLIINFLFFLLTSDLVLIFAQILKTGTLQEATQSLFSAVAFKWIVFSVSLVLLFFTVFILAAMRYGRENWFWRRSNFEYTPPSVAFYGFADKKKAFALWIKLKALYLFWYILFLLPCAGGAVSAFLLWRKSVSVFVFAAVAVCIIALALIGLLFAFIVTQRYALAYYSLFDDQTASTGKAIKESKRIMAGNERRLARLKLSFIPWFLSCVFVLPIFYVAPYYKLSTTAFCRRLYFSEGRIFWHSLKLKA